MTQGWFQGKSADTFGVGQPMTRSAFAVVLSRFFGWQSSGAYYQIFSDVPQGHGTSRPSGPAMSTEP